MKTFLCFADVLMPCNIFLNILVFTLLSYMRVGNANRTSGEIFTLRCLMVVLCGGKTAIVIPQTSQPAFPSCMAIAAMGREYVMLSPLVTTSPNWKTMDDDPPLICGLSLEDTRTLWNGPWWRWFTAHEEATNEGRKGGVESLNWRYCVLQHTEGLVGNSWDILLCMY